MLDKSQLNFSRSNRHFAAIKQKFDIDVEFYPKHPKGYELIFKSTVEDDLKEKIIKFYEAIQKN